MNIKTIVSSLNTLGFKVRISLIIVAIIPLILYLILNNIMVTNNFLMLERKNIQSRAEQAATVLKSEAATVEKVARDYGTWEDVYNNVQAKDIKWIKENITEWIPNNFEFDLVIVADKNKEIIDSVGIDCKKVSEILDDRIIGKIFNGDYDRDKDGAIYGLKVYRGDVYLLGASPILQNSLKPCQGVIIIGKKVTSELLDNIKKQFGYRIFIFSESKHISGSDENQIAEGFLNALDNKQNKDVIELGNSSIIGALPLNDISDKKLGRLFVIESREMYLSTLNLTVKNCYTVLAISIITILLLSIQLKNVITFPIKHLEAQIVKMEQENIPRHLDVKGPSEIRSLATAFNNMMTSLLKAEKENEGLKALTIRDGLTNLYNHRYFFEYFREKINKGCSQIAIMFCDIDRFKIVNDTRGHVAGDIILKETAEVISETVGKNGVAFRYGGEEFAVLLENYTASEAYALAEDIRIKVSSSKALQEYSGYFPVTISIGIAIYPSDSSNIWNVVDKADRAMYFAKRNGRNQCHIYKADIDEFLAWSSGEAVVQEMMMGAIYALAAAIDAKDSYTDKHSETVVKYSLMIADKLQMTEKEKFILKIGGLLHDCGKIGIPDEIIHKTSPLTKDEQKVINNHPILGSNIIRHVIKTPEIEACIRYHHERWDGKGYPDGLSGTAIPLHARIIGIADSYHAIISDRPYRKALAKKDAIRQLLINKGAQFDPELTDIFIQLLSEET